MKPVMYSCCEDKSQGSGHLFRSLVDYTAQKKLLSTTSSIPIDFENAAIKAINDVYPQTLVKGCHFHFVQNVWKKVENIWLSK